MNKSETYYKKHVKAIKKQLKEMGEMRWVRYQMKR